MKYLTCVLIILGFSVNACKKNSGAAVSATSYNIKLKGTWRSTNEVFDYYDASNNQLINEVITNSNSSLHFDDNNTLKSSSGLGELATNTNYTISADNGNYYITTVINQFRETRYKILVLDNSTLKISGQIDQGKQYSYNNKDYVMYSTYMGTFKRQ